VTETIIFDERAQTLFQAASFDLNPLHFDRVYSTRTQFGRPIVFGILGVIAALSRWAAGRKFFLTSLRVKFERPLFYGESYTVTWDDTGAAAKIRLSHRGAINIRIAFDYMDYAAQAVVDDVAFAPLAEPCALSWDGEEPHIRSGTRLDYATQSMVVSQLLTWTGLTGNQMPAVQLTSLLWASYFVGMYAPGRQALFSELSFAFGQGHENVPAINVEIVEISFDDRFNRILAKGTVSGLSSFRIVSYVRPKPVSPTISHILELEAPSPILVGKNAVISGGVRGFGEALAKAAALRGCGVALNYRFSSHDAARVLSELAEAGCSAIACRGDVGDATAARAIMDAATSRFGSVHYCICNASPQIEALKFSETDVGEFLDFVSRSLAPTLGLLSEFLKVAPPDAMAVLVSSVYSLEGRGEFSHYVAAKAAQEKLFESLAKEYPKQRFLVVHLPKILTDQTNVAFDREPGRDASEVAIALIKVAVEFTGAANFSRVIL
jgi:NAD(P)-dependent dehydrogenase (short-subunit alcohol dehydrogenase family)